MDAAPDPVPVVLITGQLLTAAVWAPQLAAGFSKLASLLALADIHDSIRELQFYRRQLFVSAAQEPGAPDLGDMPA